VRIVDAGMVAFAAFHALRGKVPWPLTFQVPRMIRALLARSEDAYVLCWNPDRLWKSELWPAYQAGRPEIWDLAGREDFACLLEVLTALGAVQYRTELLESDEMMAGLVHRLAGAGMGHRASGGRRARRDEIVIVSDDKDFFQLLSASTRLEGRVRGTVRAPDVKRILGVGPAYVADYLALTGDATDGIPRVVSSTAALRLLGSRGHVRDWIDRKIRVGAALERRIEEGRAQIRVNLELVDLSRAAVDRRGAPGEPILEGWGELERVRAVGERTGVAWLRNEDLATAWAPLRRCGERAREILDV
jgi:DNA polymerase-1